MSAYWINYDEVYFISNIGGAINWDDLQNKNNYVAYSVYAQSKLANILFTKELHRRMAGIKHGESEMYETIEKRKN